MSYVSLESTEPFLKCIEVIAEDKSCIVSDSVLYFSGKTGKGFITAVTLQAGIELLAINASMLTEDLILNFQPSGDPSAYLLIFDEVLPGSGGERVAAGVAKTNAEKLSSAITITEATTGRMVSYPREKVVKSIIVRVQKSGIDQVIKDFDANAIHTIIGSAGNAPLAWPINFKYRLLINDFMEEVIQHPFRELFAMRNLSVLTQLLLEQFAVMEKLEQEGNYLSAQDAYNLSRVEQHLCSHYKTEFPGIEKLSRISAMSPTSLKTKFKKYYGETLFGYYQKNKLEHARKLLDNKVPVKVVATEIGYSNPSHFTLAFKKEYGFSPWHYLNPQ